MMFAEQLSTGERPSTVGPSLEGRYISWQAANQTCFVMIMLINVQVVNLAGGYMTDLLGLDYLLH